LQTNETQKSTLNALVYTFTHNMHKLLAKHNDYATVNKII